MEVTHDEYLRKRGHLKLIQGEFHRLAFRHPPLCHERFLSPMDIKHDGWQAFAASRPRKSKSNWEHWHGPKDGTWFGRFFGRREGWNEFRSLCYSLSTLFSDWHSPVTDWMEVVHEVAEIRPSPLLAVSRLVWDWPMISDDSADYEVPERYMFVSAFRNDAGNASREYPQHPAQRILRFNVFTSSVAAIQIVMEPHLVIPNHNDYDELPFVLFSLQPDSDATGEGDMACCGDGIPVCRFSQMGEVGL